LFGAKKLPELARSLGKSLSEFKKGRDEGDASDEKKPPSAPPREPAGGEPIDLAGSRIPMPVQTVWHGLATMGSMGFTLVGCTFLGLFVGYSLDRWLKTSPCFTILVLLFGIAAGFINIFYSVAAHGRRSA